MKYDNPADVMRAKITDTLRCAHCAHFKQFHGAGLPSIWGGCSGKSKFTWEHHKRPACPHFKERT